MLTIRLQRTGKRNQADFRIVLAEKAAPVKKKFVEVLGSYNPRKKNFQVKEERVKYWISQRVEMSPTVHNLLVTKGLVEGGKVKAFNIPKRAEEKKAEAAASAPSPTDAGTPPASTSAEASADLRPGGESEAISVSAPADASSQSASETAPTEEKPTA